MSFLQLYGIGLAAILAMMAALWLVSLKLANSSIVDIFWGTGFVIANRVYFLLTPDGFLPRKLLVNALVTVWGAAPVDLHPAAQLGQARGFPMRNAKTIWKRFWLGKRATEMS